MRRAVRAIVIRDNHLLVMHRNKFGQEYYTLTGGGVNLGEDLEAALLREVAEETCLSIGNLQLVFTEEAGEPYGTQYVYICDYQAGEVQLSPDSEEAKITALGQNLYEPLWLPVAQLPQVVFRSEPLKLALIEALQHGFPKSPSMIKG